MDRWCPEAVNDIGMVHIDRITNKPSLMKVKVIFDTSCRRQNALA